jgi:hypothetical protein
MTSRKFRCTLKLLSTVDQCRRAMIALKNTSQNEEHPRKERPMLSDLVTDRAAPMPAIAAGAVAAPAFSPGQAVMDATVQSAGKAAYDKYLRWKTQPLDAPPLLSIVIPAYNEAIRIVPTIGAMASYVCGLDYCVGTDRGRRRLEGRHRCVMHWAGTCQPARAHRREEWRQGQRSAARRAGCARRLASSLPTPTTRRRSRN